VIARLAPSDPNAAELTDLRRKLDQQQQQLVKHAFDDNTAQFQEAAEALKVVNDGIGGSIQKIDQIATTIDGVNRFLASATNLVTTAAKLV
jgi:uncharacterized membrane-anchored protein YhcB (DUF1043 family)